MSLNALAKAGLIGTFLECIVYGEGKCGTLRILRKKVALGSVFVCLTSTTLLLFVLITLTLAVDIRITVGLFIGGNHDTIAITTELLKLRYGTYVSLTMIADTFLVYRVFAVWSRSLVVSATPCLLSIAGIISGGLLVANASDLTSRTPRATVLLTTFYTITLALNASCTALITFKLYSSGYETKLLSSLRLRWMSVIIESAALYLVCIIVVVVCNVVRADSVHLIALVTAAPIVGLTFSLIILRVARLSRSTSNRTFTSIDISRGTQSVLRFARQPRIVYRAGTGMDGCLYGQSNEEAKVATITTVIAQANPPPLCSADSVETRLSERDTRYR
ncbi:hypothetical protein PM082_014084 [Marasmius tenuissimus]|nr:hypothetical protein PM082_014084 [Marasmius tenuissimus]